MKSILERLTQQPVDLTDAELELVVGGMAIGGGGHTSTCAPYGADDCSAIVTVGGGLA
ncbi:MAG TPA: hypothetical protein VN947_13745 [Polyangia bacterium]|nr:hypothetical protein [Polyangia bacterium]